MALGWFTVALRWFIVALGGFIVALGGFIVALRGFTMAPGGFILHACRRNIVQLTKDDRLYRAVSLRPSKLYRGAFTLYRVLKLLYFRISPPWGCGPGTAS